MYYVGIDLGGTKILVGVFTKEGKIIKKKMIMTPREKPWEEIGNEIVKCIKDVVKSVSLDVSDIKGIGLAVPGTLDIKRETILLASNFGWKNIPFKEFIYSKINIPVKMENDVNVSTLGVSYFGEGKGVSSLIGIFIGTGIGAGIIINGELYIGYNGTAGEFGHMLIDIDGYKCGCGTRGCWEAQASRTAIYRIIDEHIKKEGKNTEVGRFFSEIENKGKALIEGYKMGLDVVREAVDESSRFLGIGLGSIMSMFNPEMIALGGGIIDDLGEFMMPVIRKTAVEYAIYGSAEGVKIIHTKLGSDGGIIGAAALAMKE
ncbi:ROK family protein [candidate division KSB1 bacterium]